MDMLPDYEDPKTPKGYRFVGYRTPKDGDWMVDYYGKPFRVTDDNKSRFFEKHPVFRKVRRKPA